MNPDTSEGSVPFPLNVAISELGEDHPITKLLIEVGAEEGDYELEDEDEFDEGESGEEEDTTDEEELEWEGDL